jgi:hypothetical protein
MWVKLSVNDLVIHFFRVPSLSCCIVPSIVLSMMLSITAVLSCNSTKVRYMIFDGCTGASKLSKCYFWLAAGHITVFILCSLT